MMLNKTRLAGILLRRAAPAWKELPAATYSVATAPVREKEEKPEKAAKAPEKAVVASYWGISPPKIEKDDGTVWRWKSFRPWETYKADLSIDLAKHHVPTSFGDRMAFWTVKALRYPTDIFFQNETLGCREDGVVQIGS